MNHLHLIQRWQHDERRAYHITLKVNDKKKIIIFLFYKYFTKHINMPGGNFLSYKKHLHRNWMLNYH